MDKEQRFRAHEQLDLFPEEAQAPPSYRRIATAVRIALLALLLLLAYVSYAQAQPQCDQRDNVLETLQSKYREKPVALGVTHNGGLVEVLTTFNGNTWSIIVTTPQGMSCLVAAGEGWKTLVGALDDPAI